MHSPSRLGLLTAVALSAPAGAVTYQSVGGEVVIEAERFTRSGGTEGGAWEVRSEIAEHTGTGYLQADSEQPIVHGFAETIIHIEYDIEFEQLGTYYVHLRTYSEDIDQNGLYAAVDGEEIDYNHVDASYVRVDAFPADPRWDWRTEGGGDSFNDNAVFFDVTAAGRHTFSLYRRNPGLRVDRIWLTQSESAVQRDTPTLALADPAGFVQPEGTACSDLLDNDGDGQIDCEDPECLDATVCDWSHGFTATFDVDSDGFTYLDDGFRATDRPAYASGYRSDVSGYSGGALRVALGGEDAAVVDNGMSGHWRRGFSLTQGATVRVALRYRLLLWQVSRTDTCSQVLVALDGALLSPGASDHVAEQCGESGTSPIDSGWQLVELTTELPAGGHAIALGGWFSDKRAEQELTDVLIDDVAVTVQEIEPQDAGPFGRDAARDDSAVPDDSSGPDRWTALEAGDPERAAMDLVYPDISAPEGDAPVSVDAGGPGVVEPWFGGCTASNGHAATAAVLLLAALWWRRASRLRSRRPHF